MLLLVNIWAIITHLSDHSFVTAKAPSLPHLDYFISKKLAERTNQKQIWMVNSVLHHPGSTQNLFRQSLSVLTQMNSYLTLFTPGYSDIICGLSCELFEKYLIEFFRRCQALNKKVIGCSLPIPQQCPNEIKEKITRWNKTQEKIFNLNEATIARLDKMTPTSWDEKLGALPMDLEVMSEHIVEAVLESHCHSNEWKQLQILKTS